MIRERLFDAFENFKMFCVGIIASVGCVVLGVIIGGLLI